jgi:predicted outer membrane repeat protein
MIVILISVSSASASDDNSTINENLTSDNEVEVPSNLENRIVNASVNEEIIIEPGTYPLHDINLTKNITLSGNGNPRDIIIDGEHKSSIFIIRSDAVHVTFKNITFINADIKGYGGAISMETGHVYVDNCIFANNTASVNAGGISNYGTDRARGYLLVNNSLFINNHGDHDGGAITTCYADSYIYNTVFINNSAHRDGGAIRVSVSGYGDVEDCIFMYNHADEWGGAYYSWSGTSNIKRCSFLNNTAETNGGAVMVSGDLNLENSIIMNNNGGETGGSFYIQQPMYDATTVINVHDNLITNNTSPYGKEIFIKWDDTKHLFTKFNNNDWGDENPNDPSVIDPDKVTPRSKVTSTIKSNLLKTLNLNLLLKYSDLIGGYYPEGYLDGIGKDNQETPNSQNSTDAKPHNDFNDNPKKDNNAKIEKIPILNNDSAASHESNSTKNADEMAKSGMFVNSTSTATSSDIGEYDKTAYELNETGSGIAKTASSPQLAYFLIALAIAFIALIIGYKKEKSKNK